MSAAPTPALLIAVTGAPGQGRTRLLAELAAEFRRAGRRVAGVLAVAGQREESDRGAAHYRLHLLGEELELPWAERVAGEPGGDAPPYEFDAATHRHLRLWADGLGAQPPADLLVLDEFGPLEARGEGLMPLWPTLAAAHPQIAVLSVREHVRGEIERRIGRRFDVCVAASAPDALLQLRRACADFGEWTRLGLWGGAAGGVEVGAGTLLHTTRVPLRGLTLSSLQAAMLTFASASLAHPVRVVWVALIAAGLKALSPGGSRFRPMIAIAMQGVLFGASVQALGWSLPALAFAGALVGAWAALQGFFVQYLLLGEELVNTYARVMAWINEQWGVQAPGMAALLTGWAALHAAAGMIACAAAWRWRAPPRALQSVIDREMAQIAPAAPPPPRLRSIGRELVRWQFWLPLTLVALVLVGSGHGWASVGWVALRFVAVGLVLVALFSLVQPAWIAETLRRRGWWGPAAAFSGAVRRVRR